MPFDPDDLDSEDPFELDGGNRPHLCGHPPYSENDLYDIFNSDARFYPTGEGENLVDGRRRAQWLMIGQPPGEEPLLVPLAAANSGDPTKARPISIYPATGPARESYLRDTGQINR